MFDIRSETKECISETTKHDIITTQDSSPDSPKLEEDEEMMQNGCKNYTTELNNDQSSSSIQCNPLNEETPTLNGNITVQRIDSEPYDSPNGLCRHQWYWIWFNIASFPLVDDAPSICDDSSISDNSRGLWLDQTQGQIDTSTDTIIPTESTRQQQPQEGATANGKCNASSVHNDNENVDIDAKAGGDGVASVVDVLPQDNKKTEAICIAHTNKISQSYNSLPRVHMKATERHCRNEKSNDVAQQQMESLQEPTECSSQVQDNVKSKNHNGIGAPSTDDVDSTPSTPKQADPRTTDAAQTTSTLANFEMATSGMPARPNLVWSLRDITQSHYRDNVG